MAEQLGSRLISSEPVSWGNSASTYRIDLADGRAVAARRSIGPDALAMTERLAAVMAMAAAVRLPIPTAVVVATDPSVWLVSPWIAGETGAAWLGTPSRTITLAGRMGSLARHLRGLDRHLMGSGGGSLMVDDDPAGLTTALQELAGSISAATRMSIGEAIERSRTDSSMAPIFVHGDFAPINVVMGPDGDIRALLDLEHAALGAPLADAAWWGWVVRHHHPEAWSTAWPAFCAAADIDLERDRDTIHALVMRQLLARAAAAGMPDVRYRWLHRLEVAGRWER